jgi:Ni,Fe-hydrogenase III small subunit
MAGLFVRGVLSGIRTTKFPRKPENEPGTTAGFPVSTRMGSSAEAVRVARLCPTGALSASGEQVNVDPRQCIHCYRCAAQSGGAMHWSTRYERARLVSQPTRAFQRPFQHSMNILVVDAGDCGACLNEVRQLNNPFYNMHRLGFFITPTPRNADVLLVVGPVTDAMRHPLLSAWEAMPEPKRVAAVGACALRGSVFGPSFTCGTGVGDFLPVDVEVPGNPPSPLAILHGLLLIAGRATPSAQMSGETP